MISPNAKHADNGSVSGSIFADGRCRVHDASGAVFGEGIGTGRPGAGGTAGGCDGALPDRAAGVLRGVVIEDQQATAGSA